MNDPAEQSEAPRNEPMENEPAMAGFVPSAGSAAGSARKNRIRSRALQLLDAAGYIPKPRLKQAMRIAARCETGKTPNAALSGGKD